jgi:hypothetical protein
MKPLGFTLEQMSAPAMADEFIRELNQELT